MAALAFHGARKTRRHRVRRRITGTERSNASPINRAGGGAKAPPCWHPCAGYSSPSPVACLDRRQPVHGLTSRVLAAAHLAPRHGIAPENPVRSAPPVAHVRATAPAPCPAGTDRDPRPAHHRPPTSPAGPRPFPMHSARAGKLVMTEIEATLQIRGCNR